MIDQQVVNKVIRIGQAGSADDPKIIDTLHSIKDCDDINRQGWKEWDEITQELTDDDLEALIKGLTIAETYHEWCGGSVSAVIWTFREAERRNIAKALSLADWILKRARNPYLPFGGQNFGAQGIEEYLILKHAHDTKIAKGLNAERLSEEQAAQERVERKKQREKTSQDRGTKNRKEFIQRLEALSPAQRLIKLASDKEYSIGFYPTRCSYIKSEIISSIDKEAKLLLLKKLKGVRKGPWKNLKQRLLSEFRKTPYDQNTPWDRKGWF